MKIIFCFTIMNYGKDSRRRSLISLKIIIWSM